MTRHSHRRRGDIYASVVAALVALSAHVAAAAPTCTTLCYVDPGGNDALNTGSSPASPLQSIPAALAQTSSAGTVVLAPGVYASHNIVTKPVALVGAGPSTILRYTPGPTPGIYAGGIVELQGTASGSSVRDLRIEPVGVSGVLVPGTESVTGLNLTRVQVVGNGGTVDLNDSGLTVGFSASLANLAVTSSQFDRTHYGWYLGKAMVAGDSSSVTNVSVTGTSFIGNRNKGIYAEKLSDATLTDLDVRDNGFPYASTMGAVTGAHGAGIDINLKNGSYQNILIQNSHFVGNGLGTPEGAAIMLKERGERSIYVGLPGHLDGVQVLRNVITGNERGVRLGEPNSINAAPAAVAYNVGPTNATIRFNQITNNLPTFNRATYPTGAFSVDPSVAGAVIDQTLSPTTHVNRNAFVGNPYGIVNVPHPLYAGANNVVDGRCNWWGDSRGPLSSTTGSTGVRVSPEVDVPEILFSALLTGPCADHPTVQLQISKHASVATVLPGGHLGYTIHVVNPSDVRLYGVLVADDLPTDLSMVAGSATLRGASITPMLSGATATFQLPSIAPGEAIDLAYEVNVAASAGAGAAVNRARVAGPDGITGGPSAAPVSIALPSRICGRVWDDRVGDGRRRGTSLGGVTVHVIAADGRDVAAATSGSDGTYCAGNLFAGAYSIRLDVPVGYRVARPGLGNRIDVAGASAPFAVATGITFNNVDAGLVRSSLRVPRGAAALRISITGPRRVTAGARATYVILVRNAGRSGVSSVRVASVLAPGTTFVRASAPGTRTSLSSGRPTWLFGSLQRGATRSIVVTVRLARGATRSLTSRAEANARNAVLVRAAARTFVVPISQVLPAVTG